MIYDGRLERERHKLTRMRFTPGESIQDYTERFSDAYTDLEGALSSLPELMTVTTGLAATLYLISFGEDKSITPLIQNLWDFKPFTFELISERLCAKHIRCETVERPELNFFKSSKRQSNSKKPDKLKQQESKRQESKEFNPKPVTPTSFPKKEPSKVESVKERIAWKIKEIQDLSLSEANNIEENTESVENPSSKNSSVVSSFCLTEEINHINVNVPDTDLVYNSGATKTTVNNFDLLINPKKIFKLMNMFGGAVSVTHVGSMMFGEIVIFPVYYSPNGPRNLVSTTQLKDHGLKIIHNHQKVFVNKGDNLVFKFHRIGDLYISSSKPSSLKTSIYNVDIPSDWHIILGHPSDSYLKKFLSINKLTSTKIVKCEIYAQCQLKKLPHSQPIPSANEPFQKIHSDVLQITPICSAGFKYVLVLIDDFTRYNKIFLLKKKSESAKKILKFIMEIRTKTEKTSAYFHSDRGGKFNSNYLLTAFDEFGITVERGPADSPQTNGLAERFNQGLLVKMRCILAQSSIPIKLWDKAARYASFLINILPSKPLSWVLPFDKLKQVNLVVEPVCDLSKLIPFSIKAFVHRKTSYKISPPSQEMLFVGYEPHLDAGRFFSPHNHHIIISRDFTTVPLNFKYNSSSLKKIPSCLPSTLR